MCIIQCITAFLFPATVSETMPRMKTSRAFFDSHTDMYLITPEKDEKWETLTTFKKIAVVFLVTLNSLSVVNEMAFNFGRAH